MAVIDLTLKSEASAKTYLHRSFRAINDLCLRASLMKPPATDTILTAC